MTNKKDDLATSDTVTPPPDFATGETIDSGPVGRAPSPSLQSALTNWGRYRIDKCIGAGGGGFVYRAFDPVLNRPVALKLLRVDDQTMARRLLQEAQTQARVDHPNVCKVYEAGTVERHPYVAMQLVEGETLGVAAPAMPLEARVAVVQQVAEGVHAAHRQGLIHRDLKPSNVMVERGDDGRWRAYVLDFGLAREMETPSVTVSGAVVGTPAYMAPEQARGDRTTLDRRTDVWGLGATLYEVLTGRPPFEVGSLIDTLMRVATAEPTPPRQLVPSLPLDLETIALKCLAKEPERRYQSARELGEELGRFLAGDPILARRTSRSYRLRRWAWRQRAVLAVAAVALVGLGVAVGERVRARHASAVRARLGQELGQTVEQIQSEVREAMLLPLHDIRPTQSHVRQRIAELEARLSGEDDTAQTVGYYAIGRAHLALHEFAPARAALERAWRGGYRTPDVALALGKAYAELYYAGRIATQLLQTKAEVDARVRELERDFKRPAIDYLRQSNGASGRVPGLVEGEIAVFEEDFDLAIAKARQAIAVAPSLYEAMQLEADAHRWRANRFTRTGQREKAGQELSEMGRLFAAAAEIGRSDPYLHTKACQGWLERLTLLKQAGAKLDEGLAGLRKSCGAAEVANPGLPEPWAADAEAARDEVEDAIDHGRDPRPAMERARVAGEHTIALDAKNANALIDLGGAYAAVGLFLREHGEDPTAYLDRATSLLQRSVDLRPTYPSSWAFLGYVHHQRGRWLAQIGKDPEPALGDAIRCHKQALALAPNYASEWSCRADSVVALAEWRMAHGRDPRPLLDEAAAGYAEGRRLNPGALDAAVAAAGVELDRAIYELRIGLDPTERLLRARTGLEAALHLGPDFPPFFAALAALELQLGQAALRAGHDPTAHLDGARARLAQAVKLAAETPTNFTDGAQIELAAARWDLMQHRSPAARLAAAARLLDDGERVNGHDAQLHLLRAELHRRAAEAMRAARKPAEAEVRAGLTAVLAALAIRPGDAEAEAVRGALALLGGDRAQAATSIARALADNPSLARDYQPLLAEAERPR